MVSNKTSNRSHVSRQFNVYDIIDDSFSKAEALLRDQFSHAMSCSPSLLLMQNVDGFLRTTQSEPSGVSAFIRAKKYCAIKADYDMRFVINRGLAGSHNAIESTMEA